jgi:hypothetical protein
MKAKARGESTQMHPRGKITRERSILLWLGARTWQWVVIHFSCFAGNYLFFDAKKSSPSQSRESY